ncbi:MAG: efflux RND transporter periplasmic adaptor subunit [bacterium]
MRSVLSAAALVLSILLAAPAFAETATPVAAQSSSDLPAITVIQVSDRKMEDHVLAAGLIGPVEQVYVTPLIEGQQIETLDAEVGDSVSAGQVLATLSTATLTLQKSQMQANDASVKAAIAQAQAQLTNARNAAAEAQKTADRSAALLKQGATSTAANDQSQMAATSAAASVTVAEQALESAKAQQDLLAAQMANVDLQLSRTKVVSPVTGVVSARNAQIGAVATAAGQPMFVIIRDGALELRADVAEADIARIRVDQPATLSLASSATRITGHVRLVEPTVDTTTRLGRARISLDADPSVLAGMYAEADILVTSRDALAVPVTAVGSSGLETTVMAVKGGLVSRVPVTTGIRQDGWVEILTGLSKGDTIVAKAGAFVNDGDQINPIPSETN